MRRSVIVIFCVALAAFAAGFFFLSTGNMGQ